VNISDRPWSNITAADYPDAASYCDACLIDLNPAGQPKVKGLCRLPVKEPNGDLNRAACGSAAAVLAGGRGGVDAPQAAKERAAQRLVSYYRLLKSDPPATIMRMAGNAAPAAMAARMGQS
jgi:hypothetical protein